MNDTEREAIILNSAWEMIDDMVNWAMFVKNESTAPTNLQLTNRACSRLFIIFLGDFLSQVGAKKSDPVPFDLKRVPDNSRALDRTFLFHLRQVCAGPKLGTDPSGLSQTVEAFAKWLEAEFTAQQVNLSAINLVVEHLRITRIQYIQMCSDIAKHSLARLDKRVRDLREVLKEVNHSVSEQDAYLAVEGFFERFQGDIFIYHSSQIAEFLNNIRWSIYEYLQPEFLRSFHLEDGATPDFPIYSYRVPIEIKRPAARAMYWNLMNRSRSKPLVQRFTVSDYLKRRY